MKNKTFLRKSLLFPLGAGAIALFAKFTAVSLSAFASFIAQTSTFATIIWLAEEPKMPSHLLKKD